MEHIRRNTIKDAWRLAKPFWTSEEKWSAWGFLLAVVALNLGIVYVNVRLNEWNNAFYNALQKLDGGAFVQQLILFCVLAAFYIVMAVYAFYFTQKLQLRWRRWLTEKYLGVWLKDRAYYHLEVAGATDNPDQRISEDLNQFTSYALTLTLGLLTSVVSLVSFMILLWGLSGPANIPLGSFGTLHLPGYLVWVALVYAGIGTWLTIKIGRPLVPLNFAQQRFEADFRFSLVRFRENAENIAFYGGEPAEQRVFQERFRNLFGNFWEIVKRQKRLTWFTAGYNQIAIIFPIVVVAPRFFAKEIGLGGLMQVVGAFGAVKDSLSFIISSYTTIAEWQAVTERLTGFRERLEAISQAQSRPQNIVIRRENTGVTVEGVNLILPDGTPLLREIGFEQARGESLLISGPTGAGKSTLLRAMAGLWPFGRGEIRLGKGSILFVPQRPYLPLGTLADGLLYPRVRDNNPIPKTILTGVLTDVGLGGLANQLDIVQDWSRKLSPGEQQRIAFARILLTKPAILFLDEVTSALDEESEVRLYGLLRTESWRPTVVSVGHRIALRRFHDKILDIANFAERRFETVVVQLLPNCSPAVHS